MTLQEYNQMGVRELKRRAELFDELVDVLDKLATRAFHGIDHEVRWSQELKDAKALVDSAKETKR